MSEYGEQYNINEILNKKIGFWDKGNFQIGIVVAVAKTKGEVGIHKKDGGIKRYRNFIYFNHALIKIIDPKNLPMPFVEITSITTDMTDDRLIMNQPRCWFIPELKPSQYKQHLGRDILKLKYNEKTFKTE